MASKESIATAFYKDNSEKDVSASAELAVPIKLLGTTEEKKRLTEIVNKASESKLGKETLEFAAKNGFTLDFTSILGVSGVCDGNKKTLSIDPFGHNNNLACILVHESRHACQIIREPWLSNRDKNSTIKTQVMMLRAMEADAQRASCVAAWQIKQNGDAKVYTTFARKNRFTAEPFEKALNEGRSLDEASTEAFKGWYDNDNIKTSYEKSFFIGQLGALKKEGKDDILEFSKNITNQDVADKICIDDDGKSYFTDNPKIFESESFLGINKETMSFLEDLMKWREKEQGLSPDKTLKEIPLRDSEKPLIDERQEQAKKEIANKKHSKEETRKVFMAKNFAKLGR